jgi:hypothetical protein
MGDRAEQQRDCGEAPVHTTPMCWRAARMRLRRDQAFQGNTRTL